MRILISILLLTLISVHSFSQEVDYGDKLTNLLSAKKWFEAETFYNKNKNKITDELTLLYYRGLISEIFNQPDSAILYNQKILDKFKDSLDTRTYVEAILIPFEQYCVDIHRFDLSQKLNRIAINYYKNDTTLGKSTDRTEMVKQLKNFDLFMGKSILPNTANQLVDNKPNSDGRIDLLTTNSDNGIYIQAKWNNINLRTIFDTGCGTSAYIWNRKVADKVGAKINYNDTIFLNGNTIKAVKGTVDSLCFGKFKIYNIPVIVNLSTIDKSDLKQVMCDSMLNSKFDIVLGLPIIQKLGVIAVDLQKNTLSFPKSPLYSASVKRNMYISNQTLYLNMSVCDSNYVFQFDTGGFFGLTMNSNFYLKNKTKIKIKEPKIDNEPHFTGGCNSESIESQKRYQWTNAVCSVNGTTIKLREKCEISLDKENDYLFGTENAGAVGNGILNDCKKVIFDFENLIFHVYK